MPQERCRVTKYALRNAYAITGWSHCHSLQTLTQSAPVKAVAMDSKWLPFVALCFDKYSTQQPVSSDKDVNLKHTFNVYHTSFQRKHKLHAQHVFKSTDINQNQIHHILECRLPIPKVTEKRSVI
jgi:hypothetical protein